MKLSIPQQTDLDEKLKVMDALINECYATHFSARTLAALLLAPKAAPLIKEKESMAGLRFATFSQKDSNALIEALKLKIDLLTIQIRHLISSPSAESPPPPYHYYTNTQLSIVQLRHCIANNASALEELKAYRHVYFHAQQARSKQ
ncbi:hypothetical protein P0D91_03635 [Pseudomonas sp. CBSPBW29]|jgi:hypothetical protein|uniref:hypothetical protein n=1 Tax=Pseudomonas sp. CBS TaxID=2971912 RepID=UPI0021ACD1FB|nr:hypothetical protein [Pseudomonas sp. CBS]WEL43449.1 hypothetical protein P0D91_03635 [Pseudomonas sp. CBSPBW29]WEL64511.1 hypothetical protein P0D93_31190 [Pseudomonas sp. CBSPGW29]WEL67988.1 hypothetical protein P0D94_17105 [Pseudomonas sp. CBSPCGW29]WEL75007.1 hypothetical protein P0D92_23145 [Pseudomonas sp. CBSPAW29]WEL80746.1 hypothetical protein P0D95_22635 [Pseudomonas sp. CBSPCAW29]WEL89267.1 hypothetical protein P0D90_04955 [Pseudomonas sp. CBSPCBW29]